MHSYARKQHSPCMCQVVHPPGMAASASTATGRCTGRRTAPACTACVSIKRKHEHPPCEASTTLKGDCGNRANILYPSSSVGLLWQQRLPGAPPARSPPPQQKLQTAAPWRYQDRLRFGRSLKEGATSPSPVAVALIPGDCCPSCGGCQ